MYTVSWKIIENVPLLQHRYSIPDLENLRKGGAKAKGVKNRLDEISINQHMPIPFTVR